MELMVGMVLGLIVVGGGTAVYLASSRSYSEVEQSAQLNEATRFAEQLMSDALRHVGFMGDVSPGSISTTDPSLPTITGDCDTLELSSVYALGTSLYALTATATGSAPDVGCFGTDDDNNALAGTEILIMKSAIPVPISDGPRDGSARNNTLDYRGDAPLTDTLANTLQNKLWVMTNNETGILFDGDGTVPSLTVDVPEGTAWEYRYEVYFILDDEDADGKLMPSLGRFVLREGSGGAMELEREELIPGVEDMRMRFGVDSDSDGDVDFYGTVADLQASGDWDNIIAIEIAMLLSTLEEDPNYQDTNTYNLVGIDVTPPATRLQHRRAVVRSNVAMRNMRL